MSLDRATAAPRTAALQTVVAVAVAVLVPLGAAWWLESASTTTIPTMQSRDLMPGDQAEPSFPRLPSYGVRIMF